MTVTTDTTNISATLASAQTLWAGGRYGDAEALLAPAVDVAAVAGDIEAEANLRVALAITLKYRNAFTRAYAEVSRVLSLSGISHEVAERARRVAISVSYELRRFDRVEQLVGDRIPELRFLAISYLKAKRHELAWRTFARVIAIAERDGDAVAALRARCDLAAFRVLPAFGKDAVDVDRSVVVREAEEVFQTCDAALAAIRSDAAHVARASLYTGWAIVLLAADRDEQAWAVALRSIKNADESGRAPERGSARNLAAAILLRRALKGDEDALDASSRLVDEMFRFLIETGPELALVEGARLAARVDYARGLARNDPDAFRSAVAWIEHADRWLTIARSETHEPSTETTDATQMALIAGGTDLYALAVEVHLKYLLEPIPAFEWAERQKGRAMTELVGRGPLPPPEGVAPELLVDEHHALAALTAARSYDDVWQAQHALEGVWRRLAADPAAASYVALRRGTAVTFGEVRALMEQESVRLQAHARGAQVALIEYVVLGDQLVAFGVRADEGQPFVHLIPGVSWKALSDTVRTAMADPESELSALLTDRQLRACVEPIIEWTAPGDVVCVVATGALHLVPLHAAAVSDAGVTLAARNPVVYAPSATTFRACVGRRLPDSTPDVAAVFSNPLDDLDDASIEGATIARVLDTDAVDRQAATRDRFLDAFALSTIVHIASHAYFEVSDPLSSAVCLADGWVTARELLGARPAGLLRLVTLSACESGIHDVRMGDELVGMTRALLQGAASVLMTLWQVLDVPTRLLMERFYDRWRNQRQPKALALAGAQQDVIAAGFTNPDEWASLALIGDWF